MKLYSEGPSKMLRRSTSLNVNKDKSHNWRDCGRLHGYTLPLWSSNPPSFNSTPNWHAPFAFLIPLIGAIAQMNFPNSSPLEEHPASIWIFIMSLLIYCFAFGNYTKFQIYTRAVALISGSLAYASLISLLVPRFLQPLVFVAWLISLITYFNRKKIAKLGDNMASKVCELWTIIKSKASYLYDQCRRPKRTNAPSRAQP